MEPCKDKKRRFNITKLEMRIAPAAGRFPVTEVADSAAAVPEDVASIRASACGPDDPGAACSMPPGGG